MKKKKGNLKGNTKITNITKKPKNETKKEM